jgi:predicted RNA-binding protein with RPS1 domain
MSQKPTAEPAPSAAYAPGDVLEGRVVKVKPFGAIVQLPDKGLGLVHISHLSNRFVQDVSDFVSPGDEVNVRVLSIDAQNGKIALSMKDVPQTSGSAASEQANAPEAGEKAVLTFEDKFKDWVRASNDRQAGLNKRNRRH